MSKRPKKGGARNNRHAQGGSFVAADAPDLETILQSEKNPFLLVLSPVCKAFSCLNNINRSRMGETRWLAMQTAARVHLRFAMTLCRLQLEKNNYFLFEHPLSASSWKLPEVHDVLSHPTVTCVRGDLCMYGMKSADSQGPGAVLKPARCIMNSRNRSSTFSPM